MKTAPRTSGKVFQNAAPELRAGVVTRVWRGLVADLRVCIATYTDGDVGRVDPRAWYVAT